ncbi:MAG: Mth938-like domain-containing protein [Candidatus Puniceispirillaceae bacterium]
MADKSSLPKGASSIVDVRDFSGDGKLTLIHGYGGGGFRIAQERYAGSQLLLPRSRFDWQAPAWDKITIDDLAPILQEPVPPLLILGLGEAPQGLVPELQVALHEKGVALEIMSTPAACRTWNVLLSEGRFAALAMMAID